LEKNTRVHRWRGRNMSRRHFLTTKIGNFVALGLMTELPSQTLIIIIVIIIIIMIEHITSACPILTKLQYINRHDRVGAQLYFNICKVIEIRLYKEH
jgi:hypothetical protein